MRLKEHSKNLLEIMIVAAIIFLPLTTNCQTKEEESLCKHNGEHEMIKKILEYVSLAPSGHNTQPWKFLVNGDSITIIPDYSRRLPAVDPEDREMFISLGCAVENAVVASKHFGFEPEISSSLEKEGEEKIVIILKTGIKDEINLFDQIEKRQTTRCEYDSTKKVPSEVLKEIENITSGTYAKSKIMTDKSQIEKIIQLVKAGNTIQFNDDTFLDELKFWIRFSNAEAEERKDGLTSSAMGNPSVPRWIGKMYMNLFLSADDQNEKDEKFIKSSSGLIMFYSEDENKKSWIETGRVYERFSLFTTRHNIKCAFINQPVEIEKLRKKLADVSDIKGKYPQLLLRFGYSNSMPKSPRRKLSDMIITGEK